MYEFWSSEFCEAENLLWRYYVGRYAFSDVFFFVHSIPLEAHLSQYNVYQV